MAEDKPAKRPLAPKLDPSGGSGDPAGARERLVAVALDHDLSRAESAPRVVASGEGAVAEQILQIAFASGVKVREDADLARLLTAVEVDDEIPVEAFAAVAEILAYIYRANRRMIDGEITDPDIPSAAQATPPPREP